MSSTFVPPLDWPHYGIGFLPAVKRVFVKYATFNGRASRSEFWWWVLANAVVSTVLYLLMFALGLATASKPGQVIGPAGWPFLVLLLVWALGTIVPTIAVSVRRLHDAGYSGWFYLFSIVGLGIVTLVLCVLETSPKAPQYGPPYPDNYGQQQPYGQQQGYGQQQPYGQSGFEQQQGSGQQPGNPAGDQQPPQQNS